MPRLSETQWSEIFRRYKSGELGRHLANEYGIRVSTIHSMFKRKGIKIHSKSYAGRTALGRVINEHAFDVITPYSAYWIGFLMADGCIQKNEISLVLCERDESHIHAFRNFLSSNNRITRITKNSAVAFRASSDYMVKKLAEYGVVPRKSFIATAPESLAFDRHFWRGVVDGDGCLRLCDKALRIHKRSNSLFKPMPIARLQLCGSRSLMDQYLTFVKTIVPETRTSVLPTKAIFLVSLGSVVAERVVSALYRDPPVVLNRKMETARKIINFSFSRTKVTPPPDF